MSDEEFGKGLFVAGFLVLGLVALMCVMAMLLMIWAANG